MVENSFAQSNLTVVTALDKKRNAFEINLLFGFSHSTSELQQKDALNFDKWVPIRMFAGVE